MERVTGRSGQPRPFGLRPQGAAEGGGGGWAQALAAKNRPFAKACDARVEITFSTSVLGKAQVHVPLKTPEVTEQLELACIATSSPCIVLSSELISTHRGLLFFVFNSYLLYLSNI